MDNVHGGLEAKRERALKRGAALRTDGVVRRGGGRPAVEAGGLLGGARLSHGRDCRGVARVEPRPAKGGEGATLSSHLLFAHAHAEADFKEGSSLSCLFAIVSFDQMKGRSDPTHASL